MRTRERPGERDASGTRREIVSVNRACAPALRPELRLYGEREHRNLDPAALPVVLHEPSRLDVLDVQPEVFRQAETGAVQEYCHDPCNTVKLQGNRLRRDVSSSSSKIVRRRCGRGSSSGPTVMRKPEPVWVSV